MGNIQGAVKEYIKAYEDSGVTKNSYCATYFLSCFVKLAFYWFLIFLILISGLGIESSLYSMITFVCGLLWSYTLWGKKGLWYNIKFFRELLKYTKASKGGK